MQGFKYFLTVVDDYSRYTWVIMLRNHIINFTLYVETQFHTKIKTIRIDNGLEFSMHAFFASIGLGPLCNPLLLYWAWPIM